MGKITDDIIKQTGIVDDETLKDLWDTVTDVKFDWHYMPDITWENGRKATTPTPGFAHLLFHRDTGEASPYLEKFKVVLDRMCWKADIELEEVIRLRLGFLMNTRYNFPSQSYAHNEPHVDFPDEGHYTACFYLNDTDGETMIFHQREPAERYQVAERSMPLKNSAIIFDGSRYHASTCPKIRDTRIVLTMNFKGKPSA